MAGEASGGGRKKKRHAGGAARGRRMTRPHGAGSDTGCEEEEQRGGGSMVANRRQESFVVLSTTRLNPDGGRYSLMPYIREHSCFFVSKIFLTNSRDVAVRFFFRKKDGKTRNELLLSFIF